MIAAAPRRKLISMSQLKRQLGVRYAAALELVESGRIKGERRQGKGSAGRLAEGRWLIPQDEVDAFIKSIGDRTRGAS